MNGVAGSCAVQAPSPGASGWGRVACNPIHSALPIPYLLSLVSKSVSGAGIGRGNGDFLKSFEEIIL